MYVIAGTPIMQMDFKGHVAGQAGITAIVLVDARVDGFTNLTPLSSVAERFG